MYSAEVSITPVSSFPLLPDNDATDATPGNTQLSLTWTAVTGATGYKVCVKNKGSAWSSAPIGSPTATLFTDMGLGTNGTKYYYSVAAVIREGTGAWSAEAYGMPTADALHAPTNIAVIPQYTGHSFGDPVAGARDGLGYVVTIASSPGGPDISGGGMSQNRVILLQT